MLFLAKMYFLSYLLKKIQRIFQNNMLFYTKYLDFFTKLRI